jgi:exodeoxyribonuclease VII large subunit
MKLLEERKKILAAEGLFDEARKQLIPFLPNVIGVVTSPTGAVIRDILHRLADRFPRRVLVWPVRVQGEASAAEVANAITGFNALPEKGALPRPDLIIVARGGGSLEDLWSFNEEIVVRAAAESMIPLISAVGHETDITLIDFAADRRAPTPTAAAEMAVPVRAELLAQINAFAARQIRAWQRGIEQRRTELLAATRALPAADDLLGVARQRLDACAERLPRALIANAQIHHTQLTRVAARLTPRLLKLRLARSSEIVVTLQQRGKRARENYLQRRWDRLRSAEQLLKAFSYQGVLARGFALVRDGEGQPLRSAAAVTARMRLEIEFSDGRVAATADGEGAPTASKPKPRARGGEGPGGQGKLF